MREEKEMSLESWNILMMKRRTICVSTTLFFSNQGIKKTTKCKIGTNEQKRD